MIKLRHYKFSGFLFLVCILVLLGCSEDKSTGPDELEGGVIYGDFGVTEDTYPETSDWDQIVEDIFGPDYRVTDWNDLVAFHNNGGDLLELYDGLGMTEYQNAAFVKLAGVPNYSETRYYYAERHEHNLPLGFLAHENIDDYLISLGSWNGSWKIFAVKTSFER